MTKFELKTVILATDSNLNSVICILTLRAFLFLKANGFMILDLMIFSLVIKIAGW